MGSLYLLFGDFEMNNFKLKISRVLFILAITINGLSSFVAGAEKPADSKPAAEKPKPEFPPLDEVLKDYQKVVSTADGQRSLYEIWTREKDGQMLAALPSGYESKKFFIALTIASGEDFAGLQAGDMYVYWKRYDKRLALIEPNIQIKSTGDQESKSSVGLAFEIPTEDGRLQTLHYSISEIPGRAGYKPRKADERVGYFTTGYQDYGQFKDPETMVRYINRWNLEKADSSLKISPPKDPIVFYIEHTTPVRYRRWVREGLLYWNTAFEKVGISNAIEVYYQDEGSGAHMEKDPEDVRYNFIRWISNNRGTAIGPSRVHPETGQILDRDVILTDGWLRHFWP